MIPSREAHTAARTIAARERLSIRAYMRQRGRWAVECLELDTTPCGTLEQWRDNPEKYNGSYRKPRTILLPEGIR